MTRKLIIPAIAFYGLFALALAGCENEGPMEEAGENMDQAVEDAGDQMEQAGDEMGDTMEEAGDKIEESTD